MALHAVVVFILKLYFSFKSISAYNEFNMVNIKKAYVLNP